MKIHIIGCSGSGKTYLANALSKKYNISHFGVIYNYKIDSYWSSRKIKSTLEEISLRVTVMRQSLIP